MYSPVYQKVVNHDSIPYRIPINKGVAGFCAQTNRVQNISNVQNCPHFAPDVDSMTDYSTQSLLCVPIAARGKYVHVCVYNSVHVATLYNIQTLLP